jgi:hypothetical protein
VIDLAVDADSRSFVSTNIFPLSGKLTAKFTTYLMLFGRSVRMKGRPARDFDAKSIQIAKSEQGINSGLQGVKFKRAAKAKASNHLLLAP